MRKLVSILLTLALAASFVLATPVAAADLNVPSQYSTIQDAINAAGSGDTIIVAAGTYAPFTVDTKTDLTIQSDGVVIVKGAQLVTTAYTGRGCVVFVTGSTDIVLDGLDIEGLNLAGTGEGGKNYGVIYENSSGEIGNCTVSPNTINDMLSIAIGIWDGSDVTVNACTIENFGRVGMLIYNACTVDVLDSTIEGQVYGSEGEVCYGIEVEGVLDDDTLATASQVTIRGNEIYNCDNTFYEAPTWQSGGVYIDGWLEYYPEADSTVIVENNDIHNNYSGIIVIKSSLSYAHFNNICNNRAYGVESLAAHDSSTAVFDATNNWWGAADGPSHSPGSGDKVSDYVDYIPWLTGPWIGGSAVGLTANVPDITAITVDPTFINFGVLYPGSTSATEEITVGNIGTRKVDVSVEVRGTVLFKDHLQMHNSDPSWSVSGETNIWPSILSGLAMGASDQVWTRLPVPGDYTPGGVETATLIFEAEPIP